jgi:DNA uptake protein ComE-like DNA-binding protein
MKIISKLLVVFVLIGAGFTSCKEASEEKQETNQTVKTEEPKVESSEAVATTNAVLNANLATEADLNTLGLSSEIVSQILEQRPLLSLADFGKLLKGQNTEELYKKVFVPLNLNTTAEADFMIIPRVGKRMAHEFEEYRPYTSVKQFKKEIGKYVDEKELKRLERLVYLKN